MRNLAYNGKENFKVLVCARDKKEANLLMVDYSEEANLESDWMFTKTSIENEIFDCDYMIQDPCFEETDVVYLEDVREFLLQKPCI